MATFLLDTSVIIDVLNNKKGRPALLRGLLEEGHLLACCAINIGEVYVEEERTAQFAESLEYLSITRDIARRAGLVKRDFSRQGSTLSLADALIAAVSISGGCTLITDNVKDFPSPELRLHRLSR